MKYKIYPPIGFARLGNSDSFFIGPETNSSNGTEIDNNGNESEVASFKDDSGQVKRMASRFTIFEFEDDGSNGRPLDLTNGVEIDWSIQLGNLKDAIARGRYPQRERPNIRPKHPRLDASRTNRQIISDLKEINGPNHANVTLDGLYLKGTTNETNVYLGEVYSDDKGRLIVLGGKGLSDSPEGEAIGNGEDPRRNFYTNPGWYDDIADGPINAEITLSTGAKVMADPGWVVVGPPDFAPDVRATTTLYDILFDIGLKQGDLMLREKPNFWTDIKPIIERTRSMRWVDKTPVLDWGTVSNNWQELSNSGQSSASLRQETMEKIMAIESALLNYNLRDWQTQYLDQWVQGNFEMNQESKPQHEEIVRSALDGTVGQGFLPGIEAGILLLASNIYSTPFDFRFAHNVLKPGWITAQMAQPWQADFLKCNDRWWPTQRPDFAPDANGNLNLWLEEGTTHRDLAENQYAMKLGVITPRPTPEDPERQVEEGKVN
ncbi:LodA/GoxA family CTQ-dependent oxidase [Ekhidna sp.]|uniref:LodA/GoxA family CTQ-dependent oxidase n=1 Tax=Ekhidna sp. TaxID=2608089 RepID=UPI003296AB2D